MKVLSWVHFEKLALLAVGGLLLSASSTVYGALLYHQAFDDYPPNTSTAAAPGATPGGGTLGVNPTGTAAVFSPVGGVFGGSLDTSGNSTTVGTARASTAEGEGNSINNVGVLNQFTISFWFNPSSVRTGGGTVQHRLLTFGDASTTDLSGANATGIWLRNNATATANRLTLDVWGKGRTVTPLAGGNATGIPGTESPLNTWTFVALTYDATSTHGNNSTVQAVATGGVSMVNGQLYHGTDTSTLTRFDAPFTVPADVTLAWGDPAAASSGPIDFGTEARLILANRLSSPSASTAFDGFMDDIRIYDTVLSAAQIERIRLQGVAGTVPEPATWVLGAIALLGAWGVQRRRRVEV